MRVGCGSRPTGANAPRECGGCLNNSNPSKWTGTCRASALPALRRGTFPHGANLAGHPAGVAFGKFHAAGLIVRLWMLGAQLGAIGCLFFAAPLRVSRRRND